MADDIKIKFGADLSAVEKAIDKVVMRKRSFPSLKSAHQPQAPFRGQGARTGTFERAEETTRSLKNLIPTGSAYQSQKGSGKLDGGKKTLADAFKLGFGSLGKKYKMDIWWKWIKGSWNVLLKTNPILQKLMGILDAALALISMALILPFLDDIIAVLKFLLQKSVDFFNWMKGNKDKVRAGAQIGVEALMAGLGLSGLVKVFGWLSAQALRLLPGFKLLEKALAPVVEWLAEKGVLGALKGIVAWVAKFVDPLLWATLIADISKYIFGWIQGWSDNPIWQAFWGGMSQLAGIVAEVTDVFGWIIDVFTGKGFQRLQKIGGDIASFGDNIKNTLGFSGSLAGGDLKMGGNRGGNTNSTTITVSGLVDEQKFRSIVKDEVARSNRSLYNTRGSVGI